MASPLGLKASSVTTKAVSTPSDGNLSKLPATSVSPGSSYRLGTAAMVAPSSYASVRALGQDPGLAKPLVSALPKHIMSSDDSHDHSDSAQSPVSPMHALDNSNKPDSTPSSVKATGPKRVRPNVREPKKTLGKHLRTDSNASSPNSCDTAVVETKKRARSNALMRTAPRATTTTTPGGLAGNSEFMYVCFFPDSHRRFETEDSRNFTATIFIIQLGPDGPQFHAHESILKRSPKLAEEIDKAKANKRTTKQNILSLMPHDAIAFEQMLQFLYKDKFLLSKTKSKPEGRLGEYKELMSLAKHYILPELQKQVVKLFSSSRILSKIPPDDFFDWAEDMYYEELDHENGPFKVYFSKVAPMLVKEADETTMEGLAPMIKQGGGFAEQLFLATATVQSHRSSV